MVFRMRIEVLVKVEVRATGGVLMMEGSRSVQIAAGKKESASNLYRVNRMSYPHCFISNTPG